jgi:hypothetical protein
MNNEDKLDEITHDIKRKADLLDSASPGDIPRLCDEIRELLNEAENLAGGL